jgi:hypothetical protein
VQGSPINPGGGSGSVAKASDTIIGITRLSAAPFSVDDPIAVGTNDARMSDARTPTAHADTHAPDGIDEVLWHLGHLTATRIEPFLRTYINSAPSLTNGVITLTYFKPNNTLSTSQFVISSTAAGTTPLGRIGLYAVDGSGNLTLVVATNQISSFPIGNDTYNYAVAGDLTTPLTSYTLNRGSKYAVAIINISGTAGSFIGCVTGSSGNLRALSPRIAGQLAGQTDLVGSIASGSVATNSSLYHISMQ